MNAGSWHFVFAEAFDEATVLKASTRGRVTRLSKPSEDELVSAVADCDALLVRTHVRVTARVLAAAARLRVIGRGGTGLDNIDLECAKARGIPVVYTPASATDAVADLAVGMMIALVRDFRGGDAAARSGRFMEFRNAQRSRELRELTVGVVGMGRIGRAVGRRCRFGFGARVLFNDIIEPGLFDFVAESRSKEELFAQSDIVSLHVPMNASTRGLIDRNALSHFKPGSFLINTSRGEVVNPSAVADALRGGRLGGAAFDVLDQEPPTSDHPLLSAPNVLLTPHVGARTVTAQDRMNDVIDDVIRVLEGNPPLYPA